ncbi:inactive serine protease PAMR1-like protein [Labeo rohita]|uniref:Inactive serine protease PAMR1-like protein n=1 Tax=Labeo rohita TaxID=84645 RepID=A0A498MWR3_LABRO|nr:inactive serine protease PAMR1-like protein [Labeo rohita]
MCRTCCEYEQISCKCPSQGTKVGYAVPCCRNVLDECDPCILHQGCSIFDNCKTCNNGTWQAKDDFYIRGMYCTSCRRGWSGGDCLTCGEVIQRPHGHVTLEGYPINAKCEWTLQVGRGAMMELRFSMISLESDHSCRYDYVEVRDGDSPKSPVIGRYCGDENPSPIRSSGNSLHIRFVSDGYNNYDGFFATFQEVSVCGKLPTASPQNFTEIHWPWHAAIYTRLYNASPLMARTKRRGDTFAVDQEEEGELDKEGITKDQRWQLVCSGALVNQHWVVVTAHCVTEHGRSEALSSDDLNVVMGKHYLRDLRENKRIQHIQVAQILIHPNYDPRVLDSDLALLKLSDKARISEYVSPVCLPRLQGGEVTAKQAYLAGWPVASQQRAHTDSEATRTGLIELADVVKCERQFSKYGVPISMSDNMLCGRQHPLSPSMICPSETGGIILSPSTDSQPTFGLESFHPSGLEDADSYHAWELLGLVSFGYDLQGCNPDLYTIYTRVANFKNWIEKNIS